LFSKPAEGLKLLDRPTGVGFWLGQLVLIASPSVDVAAVCRRCTGRTTTARPFRGRQVRTWTRGQSRFLQVRRVIVPVCRGPVLFDVLPNPGVKTVGPGAVRAVPVSLLVTLTPDQTAVRRCDDRTRAVLGKATVHITGDQRLGVDRLDSQGHASAPKMVTAVLSVLVVRAGTSRLSHVDAVLLPAVPRKHADNRRVLVVSYRGTVRVEDLRDSLQSAAGSRLDTVTFVVVGGVALHGFSVQRPPLACLSRRALLSERSAPRNGSVSTLLYTRYGLKACVVWSLYPTVRRVPYSYCSTIMDKP